MLRRFRTAGPKLKIVLGLWLCVELLSVPAAAQILRQTNGWANRTVTAEALEIGEPGRAKFLITHNVPFDVAVSGLTGNVIIMVENAAPGTGSAFETARCVQVVSPQLRTVLSRQTDDGAGLQRAVVTLFYDETAEPDIHVEPTIFAPSSQPCEERPL